MEEKDYVWCDRDYNYYTLEEIDDKYLLNILKFLSNGGGYSSKLSEEKIRKLFNEAKKRKLKCNYKLNDLINTFHQKCYYEEIRSFEYWDF